MKTANRLIKPIANPDNLRLAFWKASKGKRHSREVLTYQQDLDKNLSALRAQILRGVVEVGNYHYFKIYEPKERQITLQILFENAIKHNIISAQRPLTITVSIENKERLIVCYR